MVSAPALPKFNTCGNALNYKHSRTEFTTLNFIHSALGCNQILYGNTNRNYNSDEGGSPGGVFGYRLLMNITKHY